MSDCRNRREGAICRHCQRVYERTDAVKKKQEQRVLVGNDREMCGRNRVVGWGEGVRTRLTGKGGEREVSCGWVGVAAGGGEGVGVQEGK